MAKNKKIYVGSSTSPFKWLAQAAQIGMGVYSAVSGARARRDARGKEAAAREKAEGYLKQYEEFDPRVQSPYEDLTVNLEQARFMKEQQAQQAADTLYSLRQGGGGAGTAALATAMSRQGAINARAASASIGAQERQNLLMQKQWQGAEEQRVSEFNLQRIQNLGAMQYGIAGAEAQAGQLAQQQMASGIGQAIQGGVSLAEEFGFGGGGGSGTEYSLAAGQGLGDGTIGEFQSPASGQFSTVNFLDTPDENPLGVAGWDY